MPAQVDLVRWKQDLPPSLSEKWRECAHGSANLRAALQTPEWVGYRWGSADRTFLAVLRDEGNDQPIAVTPVVQTSYPLVYSIAGRKLAQSQIEGFLILGNVPLLPESDPSYRAVLDRLMAEPSVDGVQVMGVPKSVPFWRFLEEVERNSTAWICYRPEQPSHRFHWIEMPRSFEAYSRKFNAKERHNLKRELSQLEKRADAPLNLVKISNAAQVAEFLSDARLVAERSWQRHLVGLDVNQAGERQELLEGMARQGMLRSHVLKAGPLVFAYAVGFQLGGVYYFYETAYDDAYARYSPGKCLVQLILKDLFQTDPPRIFYFGPGDGPYKKWFANRSDEEVTMLILRNTFANRTKVLMHRTFRRCVEMAKVAKATAHRPLSAMRKPTGARPRP